MVNEWLFSFDGVADQEVIDGTTMMTIPALVVAASEAASAEPGDAALIEDDEGSWVGVVYDKSPYTGGLVVEL